MMRFSIAIISLLYVLCAGDQITFNSSALCAITSGVCAFLDSGTWNGNAIPDTKSSVSISSTSPVTISILEDCEIEQLELDGPVEVVISSSSFDVSGSINGVLNASISVSKGSLKADNISIDSLYLNESELATETLDIGYLLLNASKVHAESISALEIETYDFAVITGEVEMVPGEDSSLTINFESSLFINGSYNQDGGWIAAGSKELSEDPIIEVSESLVLHAISIYVLVEYDFNKYKEIILAKGETINLTLSEVQVQELPDGSSYVRDLSFEVWAYQDDELIVVTGKKEGYLAENYPWLVLVGVLGVLWVVMVWRLYKFLPQQTEKMGNPREVIPRYVRELSFKNPSCCTCCLRFCWIIFLIPLVVEVSAITIALAIFIPIGFIFGFVEHKFVFLWAFIVLFGQIGGILDLFADIVLLCKFLIYQYNGTTYFNDYTPEEIAESNDLEKNLFWTRFGVTLGGATISLFVAYALNSGLGKMLNGMSNTQAWGTDEELNKKARKANCCEGCCKKCCVGCGIVLALPFAIILAAALWKVLLIAVRILLLLQVIRSLWKHRKLEEDVENMVMWLECFFYLDLMWSGIPLGILTGFELFYFNEKLVFNPATTFETIKLCALGIELISASFLFYFSICGLINKVPCLQHHHAHLITDENIYEHPNSSHSSHSSHTPHASHSTHQNTAHHRNPINSKDKDARPLLSDYDDEKF